AHQAQQNDHRRNGSLHLSFPPFCSAAPARGAAKRTACFVPVNAASLTDPEPRRSLFSIPQEPLPTTNKSLRARDSATWLVG
ncbi:MAG TPA: hypothetical protein VMZ50_04415, partial [Phycisphaerae bacterium]|nr:hypothetical protein [Phycisphaerae bacterium]